MADVPAWEVINVTPTAVTNARGQLVEGFKVDVRMADGHEFYVKVAGSDYNPDTVKQRIEEVASNYVDIKTLKGDIISLPD